MEYFLWGGDLPTHDPQLFHSHSLKQPVPCWWIISFLFLENVKFASLTDEDALLYQAWESWGPGKIRILKGASECTVGMKKRECIISTRVHSTVSNLPLKSCSLGLLSRDNHPLAHLNVLRPRDNILLPYIYTDIHTEQHHMTLPFVGHETFFLTCRSRLGGAEATIAFVPSQI